MTSSPLIERLERPIPRYEQDVRIVDGRVLANPDGPEAAALIRELVEALTMAVAMLDEGNFAYPAEWLDTLSRAKATSND